MIFGGENLIEVKYLLAQAMTLGLASADTFLAALPTIKVASFLLSLIMAAAIIFILLRSGFVYEKTRQYLDVVEFSKLDEKRILRAWQKVKARLAKQQEAELRLAVVEADLILDEVLKISGYQGETMGDRLKGLTPANLSNIERVWRAHKIRNRIVHEPDFAVTAMEAEEMVDIYHKALQEFGLLRE